MTDDNKNVTDFPDEYERLKRLEALKAGDAIMAKKQKEPILNVPPMVKWLCIIFLVIQTVVFFLPPDFANQVFIHFSFIPAMYLAPMHAPLQLVYSPVSHAFLHGSWFHVLINLGMLLAFGSAVEKYTGGKKLLVIFLISAVLGALFHMIFYWGSLNPLIGASGGLSGLFGALLRILQDQGHMKPGWRALLPITLLWVGTSVLFAMFQTGPGGNEIAWAAHVGGFLGGMAAYPFIVRRG